MQHAHTHCTQVLCGNKLRDYPHCIVCCDSSAYKFCMLMNRSKLCSTNATLKKIGAMGLSEVGLPCLQRPAGLHSTVNCSISVGTKKKIGAVTINGTILSLVPVRLTGMVLGHGADEWAGGGGTPNCLPGSCVLQQSRSSLDLTELSSVRQFNSWKKKLSGYLKRKKKREEREKKREKKNRKKKQPSNNPPLRDRSDTEV